jgi:hypothetical protein
MECVVAMKFMFCEGMISSMARTEELLTAVYFIMSEIPYRIVS